ncbi:DNA topoisomerase IA (TopA) (PDB:1CY0) [Commensalibacter communis]|uniref:DNA topoisomerase 1 n=1 Tax=Commensalibacter communis TaxID=2972786 RepID=A0A9W4TPE7_9PROT|nr:type I DNA topoisomerase [Commensalibacter communis]CAI3926207.1 DNA topoisomerase IA (TopA) (PDB:1CY0) [Commensalibacter communis]CAI3927738.1 DNA topoisomerase IA (TopA) (PDB:1CY0) [Commensalibacter communis]CAI3934759.1 DNA topoisomerase IA (TopA) (PDB:1CY0) [Commensalibacter communis]CAI3935285.1 DNA topoisomerase IA (TopA) (PDB:1CY0) [Commensalibacter communis]
MTDVIIVESPAKAKTINKYLGNQYTVLASFGHVRDLPPKDGSVRPDEDFAMDWAADERGTKQIKAISQALKGAKNLYLATDPDREGEAISWHVRAMLEDKKLLKNINVERVTFNEITKQAVQHAMQNPRELDQPLIEAYLARRALDYLVGFTLSPILWRKLPGSRSAGRVQSVALRLICEREAEIEVFKSKEYWTISGTFLTSENVAFTAKLTQLQGKKLEQFDLNNEELAQQAVQTLQKEKFAVQAVERKKTKRNPAPPFTTSTLQQDASRKLHMSAQNTMRTAQQLYEGVDLGGETVGLITYMRTDGVQMASEAITSIRQHIETQFGDKYLPSKPRHYTSKAKNAQEAHEAIRPTNISYTPDQIAAYLTPDQKKLYELIWKRAVASQMQSAELDQVAVTLANPNKEHLFRATGSMIAFDGFLKLYKDIVDDQEKDPSKQESSTMLPSMKEGEHTTTKTIIPEQHFTQPPPRYSEASLVKKMEELGIGRPSTYASILGVLRDREYVTLENRYFIPQDRGRLVTAFLTSFFTRYIDVDFTANLEEKLDDISDSKVNWKTVLRNFWDDFSKAIEQTKDLKISDVIDALDHDLGNHFFAESTDGSDPRKCPACDSGKLHLKLGRYGAFIGCTNYPECQYTRRLGVDGANPEEEDTLKEGSRTLGNHPETDESIILKRGPYGLYIQCGEADPENKKKKPKRATIPKGMDGNAMTLEDAIGLLSLPRTLGQYPTTGEAIQAGLGPFGPYIKVGNIFASLDKSDNVLTVDLPRALEVVEKKMASIQNLGAHPKDKEPILLRKGRFGFYLQHKKTVAPLPKGDNGDTLTLETALSILEEKGKSTKEKTKKKKATTSTAKKTTSRKKTKKD